MSGIKGRFAKNYDDFLKRTSLLPKGLLKLVRSFDPGRILEFGCGTGTVAIGLALEGFHVVGVDISPDMLSKAREKSKGLKIKPDFIKSDIIKVKLPGKFDMLLCLGNTVPLIYRLPDARKLFRNFARHLNPGGALIIQQLNYDRILIEKPHTFAIDRIDNQIRIKQYNYTRNLIDFTVTIVDHSFVPPKIDRFRSKLRPWRKNDLISELKKSGFYKISAFGDYSRNRFNRQSKDLIITAKLKPLK